jgi:hypothetical protein
MLFAESSEAVQIINAIGTVLLALAGAYFGYLQWRGNKDRNISDVANAKAVLAVKDDLAENTKITSEVRVLTNGGMAAALRVASVALGRVADLTGHPEDRRAAELASSTLRDHKVKMDQAEVIAQSGPPPQRSSNVPIAVRPATGKGTTP